MDTVHIVVEGYARPGKNGSFIASPTSTLIETEGKRILVDPGANGRKLIAGLSKLNLSVEDIDILFLSHYHPDHFININLFPNLDIHDGTMVWRDDEEYSYSGMIPTTHIEVLPTPGHSPEHAALLVKTDEGIVCIAQDVFWWEDGKQNSDTEQALMDLEDPFALDREALVQSRTLVLDKADWIIPGHGKKFKNPRKK